MLGRINISNYILIESLDLRLPEGLVIMTGETGAGKSILLGAISLLLGAKADVSMLGDKSRNCVVEAEFSVSPSRELLEAFEAAGMDFESELILRRVISPNGRSRSFLNDEPVSMQFLASISSFLVDIHSQHQQLMLADEKFRMSVLDVFADNKALLSEFSDSYSKLAALDSSISSLSSELDNAARDREYRQFQLDELVNARLSPGEMEELEAEQKELSHAGEIRDALASALSRFTFGEYSFVQELKESIKDISRVSSGFPRFSVIGERLESCRIELQDIESELEKAIDSIVVSPERLEQVEERLSLLWGLMGKHGCRTVEALIERRDSFAESLSGDETAAARLEEMKKERSVLASRLDELAERLHDRRVKAASGLSSSLQKSIRSLEMPYSVFNINVEYSGEIRHSGKDTVRFMFSSSPSVPAADVTKAASGGELSRIMLCVKSLLASHKSMATLIFDEIDTGVSGSTADRIGMLLGEMGRNMQIVAITHLPQVAARGSHHFCVRKNTDGQHRAVTTVVPLSGEERTLEIARLLSGAKITDAAMKNAEALLNEAGNPGGRDN